MFPDGPEDPLDRFSEDTDLEKDFFAWDWPLAAVDFSRGFPEDFPAWAEVEGTELFWPEVVTCFKRLDAECELKSKNKKIDKTQT